MLHSLCWGKYDLCARPVLTTHEPLTETAQKPGPSLPALRPAASVKRKVQRTNVGWGVKNLFTC